MVLSGTLDEWKQDDFGRWFHVDHPEDGVITLRDGLSFADYYARRAQPEPPPDPDPYEVRLAALEANLAELKASVKPVTLLEVKG